MPCSRPLRRRRRPVLFLALILHVLLFAGLCGQAPPARAGGAPPAGAASLAGSKEDLEKQKLAQEILQLKNANASHVIVWDRIASLVPLITVLVAVAGVLTTIIKMGMDNKQAAAQAREQAQSEREQRDREREQREAESLRWQAEQQAERRRQLEESFGTALTGLRGDDDAGKAGAVVALMSFLQPEYARFHEQVYLILNRMLKLMGPPLGKNPADGAVKPLFVRAFEQAFRVLPAESPLWTDCDLARMYLCRAQLSGLTLHRADVGFSAMHGADLTGADLFRVRGIKVQWQGAHLSNAKLGEARLKKADCRRADFRGARLVAAVLKGADLREADFRGALLQSAHLEKADLVGANFQGADLSDTYFREANFDEAALQSIARAKIWKEKAAPHFSDNLVPKRLNRQLKQALAAVEQRRKAQTEAQKAEAQKAQNTGDAKEKSAGGIEGQER